MYLLSWENKWNKYTHLRSIMMISIWYSPLVFLQLFIFDKSYWCHAKQFVVYLLVLHLPATGIALSFSVILQIVLHCWVIIFQNVLCLSARANSSSWYNPVNVLDGQTAHHWLCSQDSWWGECYQNLWSCYTITDQTMPGARFLFRGFANRLSVDGYQCLRKHDYSDKSVRKILKNLSCMGSHSTFVRPWLFLALLAANPRNPFPCHFPFNKLHGACSWLITSWAHRHLNFAAFRWIVFVFFWRLD